jgi:hypothetical protein
MLRLTERQYARLKAGRPIGRATKYGAKRTVVDGIAFQSAFEARHYGELKLRERAGLIRNLRCQVNYPLTVAGILVTTYRADFVFEEYDGQHWHTVISDTKSEPTRRKETYQIKKRFMAALGWPIRETISR